MQIKKCDKCGAEIIEHPIQQTILPHYSILAMYNACNVVSVDLCSKCQGEFEKWLHGKNECEEREKGECSYYSG